MTMHCSSKAAIVNKPLADVTAGTRGPVQLTDTELDRVAAAGSKPGPSPGIGVGRPLHLE